jgi:transcriptional regulator with XRE-family HTH domain
VPARGDQSKGETRLAQARIERGLSQREMAEATGLSQQTYWRLERGRMSNPPLRYLVNCSIVLQLPLEELLEPVWLKWLDLGDD